MLAVLLAGCGGAAPDAVGQSTARGEEAHAPAAMKLGSRVHVMKMQDPNALTSAATSTNLLYYGGHVISNVKVVEVNWGSGVNSQITSGMGPFYGAFTQSPMFDWLNEYNTDITAQNGQAGTNQVIGHGTFDGMVTISPSDTATTVDDTNIQSELNSQISAGNLPAPDANTIYMINFPKGITITQGGSSSCQQFCAYHGTFTRSGQSVYYGVLPSLESGTGCDLGCGGSTFFNNSTSVASHELVEAVTDAEVGLATSYGPPLAWYDPDPNTGEIGDICNAQQGTFTASNGTVYTVQKEWSNQQQACITQKSTTTQNDFSLSLSSSSVSVAAGSSATLTVSTAVTAGSAESITLSVSGLPSGVTGSFSPATVTSGQSSTLTLSASSSAAAGSATFTVTGSASSGSHSQSGTVTVTTSAGGGGGTLSNGVPVTGLSGATGSQVVYTMTVPSGASGLTFQISGGTGDADLYVKFGSAPTLSSYDCRPYVSGNNETCNMSSATAGTWYVMINGYAAYSGLTLEGSYSTSGGGGGGGTALTNGVPVSNLSGATGSQVVYTLSVPSGASGLTFQISGGSGDADLYVKYGSAPTTSSYDCRPYVTGNNETCNMPTASAGTWYVMINGYSAYSGLTLVGSYSTSGGGGGGNALTNGVPVTISGATGAQNNYTLAVTSGTGNVTVSISGGTGDADLYVKYGSAPTLSSYDCRPYLYGNNETCTVPRQAGTLYVMVNGYQAYSGVSLVGSY